MLKNQQKSTIIYEGVDQTFKDQAELKGRICQVWQSASNQETVLRQYCNSDRVICIYQSQKGANKAPV